MKPSKLWELPKEEWRILEEANNEYLISNHGRVKRVRDGKIMAQYTDEATNYPSVRTKVEGLGKMMTFHIHRLVIKYFYGGEFPEDYQVHHKEYRLDSNITNLIPLSPQEHAQEHKRINNYQLGNICLMFDANDKYIGEFESWYEAAKVFKQTPLQLLRASRRNELINGIYLEALPLVRMEKYVNG